MLNISALRLSEDIPSPTTVRDVQVDNGERKKSVRFADDRNEIHTITHRDEIPVDVISATWYAAEDYNDIKRSYQKILYVLSTGVALPSEHTARGLEFRTREGFYARLEKRRNSCSAVLEEQSRQWDAMDYIDFFYDDEMIARIYRRFTTKCAAEAALRARQDEKEALEIQQEQETPISSSLVNGEHLYLESLQLRATTERVSRTGRSQITTLL